MDDYKKLKSLAHYCIYKCSSPVNEVEFGNILWLVDSRAYVETGKSISEQSYIKTPYGFEPKGFSQVLRELEEENNIAKCIYEGTTQVKDDGEAPSPALDGVQR